jgi:hypothetical protein
MQIFAIPSSDNGLLSYILYGHNVKSSRRIFRATFVKTQSVLLNAAHILLNFLLLPQTTSSVRTDELCLRPWVRLLRMLSVYLNCLTIR